MKKILIIITLFVLLGSPVGAESYEFDSSQETNLYDQMYDDYGADDIYQSSPDEFKEFSYKIDLSPSDPFSLANIFKEDGLEYLKNYLSQVVSSPIKYIGIMLLTIIVCALMNSLADNRLGVASTLNTAATLICTVSFLLPVSSLIAKSVDTISTVSTFMLVFIPIFAGILIACIKSSTAATYQTVMFFATQAVTYCCTYIVLPFTNCYTAVAVASSVSGSDRLVGVARILKKTAFIAISAAMAVFLAVLSVQSVVSGVADNALTKTAKFFISSFVPIIGSSVSEALGSIKSCVGVLKSSVGIYAVIVILFLCVPIILEILFYKLALTFCSGVAEMFSVSGVKNIADSINGSLSIVLSVVICVSVMFVFSLTVISLTGGSV